MEHGVRRLLEAPSPSPGRRRRGASGQARPGAGPGAARVSLPARCLLPGALRPPLGRRHRGQGPAGCRGRRGSCAGAASGTPGCGVSLGVLLQGTSVGELDSPQDKQVIVRLLPGVGAVTL